MVPGDDGCIEEGGQIGAVEVASSSASAKDGATDGGGEAHSSSASSEKRTERLEAKVTKLEKEREKIVLLARRAQTRIMKLEKDLSESRAKILDLEGERERTRSRSRSPALGTRAGAVSVSDDFSLDRILLQCRTPLSRGNTDEKGCERWFFAELASSNKSKKPKRVWLSEQGLQNVLDSCGKDLEQLSIPPECLAPDESTALREELASLAKKCSKAQEDFRRFRVRSEIVRRQKESELGRLKSSNLRYKQHNIGGEDVQNDLETARAQIQHLVKERESSREKAAEHRAEISSLKARVKELADISEQMELAVADAAGSSLSGNGARAQLAKLQREYDNYRKRALKMIEERGRTIEELQKSSSSHPNQNHEGDERFVTPPPGGRGKGNLRRPSSSRSESSSRPSVDLAYLRNIVLKYMAAENTPETKGHMEAAIATVLRFTPQELQFVHGKRQASGWSLF